MANIVSGGNKANINFNNISGPSDSYGRTITGSFNTNSNLATRSNNKTNTETYDFFSSGQNTISNDFLTSQNSISNDFPTSQNSISNEFLTSQNSISRKFPSGLNSISNNFPTGQNSISRKFPTGQNSISSKNIPSSSNSISSNNYPSRSNSVSNNNVETNDFIASALNSISNKYVPSGLNSISSKDIPSGSNSTSRKFPTGQNSISNKNTESSNFFPTNQNSISSNNAGISVFFPTNQNSIPYNKNIINISQDMWIDIFYEEISDLKLEKKILEEAFYQFNNTYHPGLAYSDHTANVICFNPEQYAQNALAVEKWLAKKEYPTWEGTNKEQALRYQEGMKKFQEYLEGEYESYYNLCFKEFMKKYIKEYASSHNLESEEFMKELISKNIFYNEYCERLSQIEKDLADYKAAIYSVEQQKKLLPYVKIMETDSYKEFANNTWSLSYFKSHTTAADFSIPTLQNIGCLSENEKILFFYLYETQGTSGALAFLEANEDKINQVKGKREAEQYLASITKPNGEIDYNALTTAITAGKGIFDGIDSFFEGLFSNLFATEGMISQNQYAQMYILQALMPGKMYLDNIIENLARTESFRTGCSIQKIKEGYKFYNDDGSINFEFAKEKLSSEQYNKLVSIVNSKSGGYDHIYQISTSIGNMLPSIAVSSILSILATPTVGSIVGSTLMGASSAGNAKNQALISGNDMLSSTIYGLMTGLSETTLGLLLGNIPGLNANAKFVISGFLSEGTEEFIQTYVDAGLRASILGENVDMSLLLGEGGKSFVYGMITSGIMNGGNLVCKLDFNQATFEINSVNDLITFIGVFNSDEMFVQHVDGKDVIVFRGLADVSSEKINKIKQIFPEVELQQIVSKDGATITIMSNDTIQNNTVNQTPSPNTDINKEVPNIDNNVSQNVTNNNPASYSNQLMTELIDSIDNNDIATFQEVWEKINNADIKSLEGFNSVKEYKEYIIDELISSGKINDIKHNGPILLLALDSVMIHKLIGNEKLNGLITKNLHVKPNIICQIFKNMNIDEINTIFNDIAIKEYINSLSIDEFKKIITQFNSSNLAVLEYNTFKDRILNMSDDEFNIIADFIKEDINDYFSINNKSNAVVKDGRIVDLDRYSYYTVTCEYNGEVTEYKITTKFINNENIYYLTNIEQTKLLKAMLCDKFKIISIDKNEVASTLYISSEDGLQKGLNKIRLLINGIEQTLLINSSNYSNTEDLNNRFKDVTSAEILSVEPIQSLNIGVNEAEANNWYRVEYYQNGVKENIYLKPTHNGESYVLDIDTYLVGKLGKNNIGSDIKVEMVNKGEIDYSQLSVTKYSAAESIFRSSWYGGNQGFVKELIKAYINNDINSPGVFSIAKTVYNVINKYFPNMTNENMINIANSYEHSGCGYMAIANAICTYMGSIENGSSIFKEKYGFDLYVEENGFKHYNLEAVALDIFCNRYKNKSVEWIISSERGISTEAYSNVVQDYFSQKGIEVRCDSIALDKEQTKTSLFTNILDASSDFMILTGKNFDLELLGSDNVGAYYGSDGAILHSEFDGKIHKDIGAHAMLITGVDESGDVTVSSWANQYKFIGESIHEHIEKGQNSYAYLWTLNFNIKED